MPFNPTTFNAGAAPGISAAELNKLGSQYSQIVTDYVMGKKPNLIFNGSGEYGWLGWTNTSGWWVGAGGAGEGNYFSSPNVAATGSYNWIQSAMIATNPGEVYTAHAEVWTNGMTAGTAHMEIHFFDSSQNDLGGFAASNNVQYKTDGWAEIECIGFTTPANTAYIAARLVLDNTALGFAEYRRVKVESGSVYTGYSDEGDRNFYRYAALMPFFQGDSYNYIQVGSGNSSFLTGQQFARVNFPGGFKTGTTPIVIAGLKGFGSTSSGTFTLWSQGEDATGFSLGTNFSSQQTVAWGYIAFGQHP